MKYLKSTQVHHYLTVLGGAAAQLCQVRRTRIAQLTRLQFHLFLDLGRHAAGHEILHCWIAGMMGVS